MFTIQHYKAIAEIIAKNSTKEVVSARLVCLDIAWDLQKHFAKDNPKFDKAKFMKLCGITD